MADEAAATPEPAPEAPTGSLDALAASLAAELEGLARELDEIGLLVGQSRAEAGHLEQKRAAAAGRLEGLARGAGPDLAEAASQLAAITRRASAMESQVEVLDGRQRTLERHRDSLEQVRAALATLGGTSGSPDDGSPAGGGPEVPEATGGAGAPTASAMNRVVLAAQEDLRRDIARAMHDGPAQSLANITLQAQIVERLIERDPAAARGEVRELTAMVQRTLDATKTFIFDVRPMVLDDLGLVPTLRRVARDRSRRTGVPVEFESLGADRRLPMELESAVFRVADEAVAALAGGHPERVAMTLDWGEELELAVQGRFAAAADGHDEAPRADMPDALREMVDERLTRAAAASRVALLTAAIRREIGERAAAAGGRVIFAEDGRAMTAHFPLPPVGGEA